VSEAAALIAQGKVRDIYDAGDDRLLLVASDRISTYDVVHPTPIPDKGKVLTGLTAFWLERTGEICPNHLISTTDVPEEFRGRAMLVERLEMARSNASCAATSLARAGRTTRPQARSRAPG
jgi:phosphoribosylaminoimidazole-succinocarboxamide synthase